MSSDDNRERIRQRLSSVVTGGDRAVDEAEAVGQTPVPSWLGDDGSTGSESWVPPRFRGARWNVGKRGAVALVGVGVLAALLTGIVVIRSNPAADPVPPLPAVTAAAASSSGNAPPEELVVSVVGLVRRGGLVRLPPGARIADAIAAAGGAENGADLLVLNMAQRLSDGDQIMVSPPGAAGAVSVVTNAGSAPAPAAGKPAAGGKISLNAATEQQLDALPGVGPVTAASIVAWRTANGRFTDVGQLGEVDGIGPARLAKLRDLVTP